MVLRENISTK